MHRGVAVLRSRRTKRQERLRDALTGCVCEVVTERPVFHLTFDDGPHPEVTPSILDVLDEFEASATFFLLVDHAARYPYVAAETLRRGHEIGLHGRTHMRLSSAPWRAILDEVGRAAEELAEIIGRDIDLFRPTYGEHGLGSLAVARMGGMKTVLWSVDTYDWKGIRRDAPVERITDRMNRGGIGLIHDTPVGKTVAEERARGFIGKDALTRALLTGMEERALRSVTLQELLGSGREVRRTLPAT